MNNKLIPAWSEGFHPQRPLRSGVGERCIVKGCQNHKEKGEFVDDICGPCYNLLVSGEFRGNGTSFIYDLRNELRKVHDISINALSRCSGLQ